MRADALVRQTLEAVLPPNVPPSFRDIVGARFVGKNAVTAGLIMVDGLPATVSLTRWAFGWSHRFTHMEGGALSFENGAWVRVDDPQYALPLTEAA
ncbi:hypothetical protein [Bosea sp. UNC402CLCol]|uniref:hypothetical protein n=1 Tax=Bosea sp. UNC402CLCol TaxID=1510531 RepID=UPI00056F8120|nr:hypothetical protein [Bosea sp. UNC402CLCol]